MAAPKADYYTVSTSFYPPEGDAYLKGEVIAADDPALKRWPEYFEPLVVRPHFRSSHVEQATAAPGEKRTGKALTTASLKGK